MGVGPRKEAVGPEDLGAKGGCMVRELGGAWSRGGTAVDSMGVRLERLIAEGASLTDGDPTVAFVRVTGDGAAVRVVLGGNNSLVFLGRLIVTLSETLTVVLEAAAICRNITFAISVWEVGLPVLDLSWDFLFLCLRMTGNG